MSPTARTLARLRQLGFLADVCERFIAAVQRKRDLFGVADVIAVHPRDRLMLLVQATSRPHVGDRLKRLQARPETRLLLKTGIAVEVWGWYRSPAGRWDVVRVGVEADTLAPVPLTPRRRRRASRQRELFE
jgi:hypothetical protein